MKILQLSYSLSSGGGERFVVDLCNRLAQSPDNEVVLVTTDDDGIPKNVHYLNDLSEKVRFVNLHCRSGLSVGSFRKVFMTIKRERPDIVHAHCGLMLLYLPALFLKHSKFFHTLHNLAEVCLRSKKLYSINKWLYGRYVQPITISKRCQDSYVSLYGMNNAVCITNGREPLVPSSEYPEDITFLKDTQVPVFVHVARCCVQKNQNRLFSAFERLLSEGIEFQLIVIGSGYENMWMKKYAGNKHIHVLGEKRNVADYMATADFFVLSSDYEGLPLTLLEAMSLGVVPVCTPAGGVVDVIEDGRNGYMASSFDDDAFFAKLKQAIMDRDTISKDAIRKDYEENYSMELCAEKYYKEYKKGFNKEI